MNVLLISPCSKNALTETRRILDQFAERRGERTRQTPIAQHGLDTLRRQLRKTVRKGPFQPTRPLAMCCADRTRTTGIRGKIFACRRLWRHCFMIWVRPV